MLFVFFYKITLKIVPVSTQQSVKVSASVLVRVSKENEVQRTYSMHIGETKTVYRIFVGEHKKDTTREAET
jgi:hypothetical protein